MDWPLAKDHSDGLSFTKIWIKGPQIGSDMELFKVVLLRKKTYFSAGDNGISLFLVVLKKTAKGQLETIRNGMKRFQVKSIW